LSFLDVGADRDMPTHVLCASYHRPAADAHWLVAAQKRFRRRRQPVQGRGAGCWQAIPNVYYVASLLIEWRLMVDAAVRNREGTSKGFDHRPPRASPSSCQLTVRRRTTAARMT
jgi:uncharacterized membrane protein